MEDNIDNELAIERLRKKALDISGINPMAYSEPSYPLDLLLGGQKVVESVTTAPIRSAMEAQLNERDPLEAYKKQFFEDPTLAPSQESIDELALLRQRQRQTQAGIPESMQMQLKPSDIGSIDPTAIGAIKYLGPGKGFLREIGKALTPEEMLSLETRIKEISKLPKSIDTKQELSDVNKLLKDVNLEKDPLAKELTLKKNLALSNEELKSIENRVDTLDKLIDKTDDQRQLDAYLAELTELQNKLQTSHSYTKEFENSEQLRNAETLKNKFQENFKGRFGTDKDYLYYQKPEVKNKTLIIDTYGKGDVHNAAYTLDGTEKSKIKEWNKPMPFPSDPEQITRYVQDHDGPIIIGAKSDPFMWMDSKFGSTTNLMDALKGRDVTFRTRSDLIAHTDYLDKLKDINSKVQIYIPAIDDKITRLVQPGAPSIKRRLDAVKRLKDAGINVEIIRESKLIGPSTKIGIDQKDIKTLSDFEFRKLMKENGISGVPIIDQ